MDIQDVGIGRVNPKQENPEQLDADCGMLEGWGRAESLSRNNCSI